MKPSEAMTQAVDTTMARPHMKDRMYLRPAMA